MAPHPSSAGNLPGSVDAASLRGYLDRVASDAPAPGGGSVVGVVAALGAALGAMVCRLTGERTAAGGGHQTPEALRPALAALEAARAEALRLAAADEAAYAAYRAAASLPRNSEAERAIRHEAVHVALRQATDMPLALAATCLGVLDALEEVARHGTRHALSDATIGAWLAGVALRGALLIARGNAAMLADAEAAAAILARAGDLERAAAAAVARVEQAVAAR